METVKNTSTIVLSIVLIIAVIFLALGSYRLYRVTGERNAIQNKFSESNSKILSYEAAIVELQRENALSEEEIEELEEELEEERDRNDDFEDQLDNITGTVGKLDKLAKLDPELLQKYSQVYFLNEHYSPDKFEEISSKYLVNTDEKEYIHAEVADFWKI